MLSDLLRLHIREWGSTNTNSVKTAAQKKTKKSRHVTQYLKKRRKAARGRSSRGSEAKQIEQHSAVPAQQAIKHRVSPRSKANENTHATAAQITKCIPFLHAEQGNLITVRVSLGKRVTLERFFAPRSHVFTALLHAVSACASTLFYTRVALACVIIASLSACLFSAWPNAKIKHLMRMTGRPSQYK